jgi:two-component system, chemotaxis family, response regulator Rcp1
MKKLSKPLQVLLLEDNPGDVRLVTEAIGSKEAELQVARDGKEGIAFLRKEGPFHNAPRPDLILLDLKLPRRSGLEVLADIKSDPKLRRIPIIVLTSSEAEDDVRKAYDLGANCYLSKQLELDDYFAAMRCLRDFWFGVVNLPSED